MMEVTITNPGIDPHIIDVNVEAPKRPVDAHRYATFNFSCDTDEPIQLFSHIKLKDRGKVLFRGYVYYYKKQRAIQKSGFLKTKLNTQCRGEEEQMMHRYSPRIGWQGSGGPDLTYVSYRLHHIFADSAPNQTVDEHGMVRTSGVLFLMNSYVPPFQWTYVDIDKWIWKLPGHGLNSRIGNTDIYIEGQLLARKSSYATCEATDNSCYSDAVDLYVHINDSSYLGAYNNHLSAYNAFDTNIRKGTLDKPDTLITGHLQLNNTRWGDLLINLAEFYELTPHFRYTENYTYLDMIDES